MEIDEPLGKPTLDFIRDSGLKGSKEVCHEGDCGACMILLGELKGEELVYRAVTSCILPLGEVEAKHVVTIEGINQEKLSPIQQALVDTGGVQCGYCTPGFVISLTGFFMKSKLGNEDILTAIEGNVCRCTGHASIIRAAKLLSEKYSSVKQSNQSWIKSLIDEGILPGYFEGIKEKLKELKKAKRQTKGRLVAGGTDLFVQNETIDNPVFLSNMGLDKIWSDNDFIHIGTMANTEQIRLSPELNMILDIEEHLSTVSSLPIRKQATIGGNIANASPIGDLTIYFLALNADISIRLDEVNRIIKLKDFYKGYKILDLQEGEILEWVRIRNEKKLFSFEKVAKREHLDIASVNSALSFTLIDNKMKEIQLSAGGIGPIPMILEKTSALLENKEISSSLIKEAAEIALTEISPIDDVRGSAKYKSLLLRQLIYAHFLKLFPAMEESL
ncbi:MAG: FAD binding domain-containing protein [Candidatus Heimdallarchaeota archaeon]|nr:FAD binding domain-containing protein [Candidatus Heimdallarchaeota archaeon]